MSPVWILLTLLPILGGAERFNCKGRILGAYYADAKSGCKAFHVCVRVAGGGVRDFRFFCPPGTLFHQEAQTCTDWGDDDPLACPADIYDGQFDLYKIGSGFDTRKLSSPGNREDEVEFGLQRAETGDRRLAQNNVASNGASSDLRAAHSSDFFTGQRDRGRDDPSPPLLAAPQPPPVPHQAPPRQSFRRATTQRITTIHYTTAPPPPPQPSSPPQYETSKRKLVRKRPIYVSTPAPAPTFLPNPPQQSYPEQTQQNLNRREPAQNRQTFTTPNLPPQFKDYKDEYVEVSRVTPKQNKHYQDNQTPSLFVQTTPASHFIKKEALSEQYNYDAQSTPGLNVNVQNNNRPFKVRNGFSVSDVPRESESVRTKNLNNNQNLRVTPTTTIDYNIAFRSTSASTPTYKNYNSVSYEPEKNNYVPYSKQNYFNNPTTIPPTVYTTAYTTTRPDPLANLNTVAYNTNIGFDAQPNNNYPESDEDDGQYRPPQGEDDGLYRPELYEKELLSGAHSLNIAASGNRLPEDQKPYGKTRPSPKAISQTAAPRPFYPPPKPTSPPVQTSRAPETYTTTQVPQTVNTQRTFDYYQTYTTTSRPGDFLIQNNANNAQPRVATTPASRAPETRGTRAPSRVPTPPLPPTQPSSRPPRPTTRVPHFPKPSNHKEDSSYDYAYYDSDPGFSEYDHIEEFGKTKNRN